MIRACLSLLVIGLIPGSIARAQVADGGFESDDVAAWQPFGANVMPERVQAPGWLRFASSFNTRQYEQLRIYLRIQTGTGTICFDDVRIGDLELQNAGFEEADGDQLVGWEQDNIGETIFSTDEEAYGGSRSACIRQTVAGVSRIFQDADCKPDTDYEASVWIHRTDLWGDVYAEIYGVEDGELHRIVWQSDHVTGGEDASLGDRVLLLQSEPGSEPAGIEQIIATEPGQNFVLRMDAAAPLLVDGEVALTAMSGGEQIAEIRLNAPMSHWGTHRVILQSPIDGRMTLRVTTQGDVPRAYVDNITIGPPGESISALRAQFVGAERNLVLGEKLYVEIAGVESKLVDRGIAMLGRRVSEATKGRVAVLVGEGTPRVVVTVTGDAEPSDVEWWVPEGYTLRCSQAGVRIVAPSERGAFFALMVLPELLDRAPGALYQLIAANIEDRPAMPFRGTYMAGLPRDRAERLSWCERLAALRMNAVVIEDDIWWRLDDPVQRKVAQDAFDDFRAYGIDPIPELQSFGWGHLVLRKDPMCAEGQWVEREEIRLTGEDAVELTHPNILRTESTDIVLRGPDGVVLREGQDYRVIAIAEDDEARVETVDDPVEGVTEHVYRPEARKRRIQRVVGGRIADGTTVQASYDYVARVNQQNCPYCPSEPRVAEIMVDAVRDTVKHLKPTTIHIGHDEPAVMNSDSRCIARGLSNAELLAEDVQRLYDAARELDPEIDIMMWADAVNPYHNGLMFPDDPTSDALDLLPKDVILNVWYYGADQPLSKGAESLRCLASKGFATTGSPWFDVTCATRWSQACYASRLRGENCLGVLYTSWGGRWDALATSGNTAWKPPDIAAQPEVDGG